MDGEIGVVVTGVAGDLTANPWGGIDMFLLVGQFHLRDHKALILSLKFIDFPDMVAVRDPEAPFLNDQSVAEREHDLGILDRDGILEFLPADTAHRPLDRQEGFGARNPDTDGASASTREIPLGIGNSGHPEPPLFADHQEFPLDLNGHAPRKPPSVSPGKFKGRVAGLLCGEFGVKSSHMWLIYAIAASLCWGMSYAASGPILKKGFSPLVFFFGYTLFGLIGASAALLSSGKLSSALRLEGLAKGEYGWFFFSVAGSALGAYLTYAAMSAKNPTIASLIEISYPLFVVLFAWVFFREMQLNTITLIGGGLVLAGVAVITLGER